MKTIKINESQLHTLIKESVKKVLREMDELSPALLQRASDRAEELGRWSQRDSFGDEAEIRAGQEFNGDANINVVSPKKIWYVNPHGDTCGIFREGTYAHRPKNGYNNETGHLTGMTKFPEYMKVQDKRTARAIARWWKTYYAGERPVPFMEDWHNLLAW